MARSPSPSTSGWSPTSAASTTWPRSPTAAALRARRSRRPRQHPDTDPDDDVLVDNEIGNGGGDEDDHDIASIGSPPFDLALRKTLSPGQSATVWPGDDVSFALEVFNQGEQAATDIVVTDAIPAGMAFDAADNPGWSLVAGQPTTTIAGPLAPGASITRTIVLLGRRRVVAPDAAEPSRDLRGHRRVRPTRARPRLRRPTPTSAATRWSTM